MSASGHDRRFRPVRRYRTRSVQLNVKDSRVRAAKKAMIWSSALDFERQLDLRALCFHLSLRVQLHIEFDDFCDANIAERFGGLFDRVGGGLFPRFLAAPDQQNHIVDAIRHVVLPLAWKQEEGCARLPGPLIWINGPKCDMPAVGNGRLN